MQRSLVAGSLIVLGLTVAAVAWIVTRAERTPIVVGLLHSQTGKWTVAESSMLEGELLAIEEINAAGGLLGRPIQAVIGDGRSDPAAFASEARRLIQDEKVSVLFGCWDTRARHAVKSVVESAHHLLIYPPAYEGFEDSPDIIYVGGLPNQQINPSISWCRDMPKAQTFFLVASSSFYSKALAELVKDQVRDPGAADGRGDAVPGTRPDRAGRCGREDR